MMSDACCPRNPTMPCAPSSSWRGAATVNPVQIAEIADAANIPKKFLEQILLELKKPGIVRSHRGRSGGYSLGRPAKDISFADVLRVTDGPLALTSVRQRDGLSQMRRLFR